MLERASGGGHFELTLVSLVFAGVNAVARHRLVSGAGRPIPSRIHALSLRAYVPGEPSSAPTLFILEIHQRF